MEQVNFWEFFAGLGIFLFGMSLIENALSKLAGRSFKKWLRKYTQNPISAIFSGTVITALLQSSSVVSLMVLAFVGAGIIELSNAIGIILGSNLGTTFTGWLVAYLGFSIDIESIALPGLAIGGLGMVFFSQRSWLFQSSRFLAGLGFLLYGLGFMKSSIDLFAQTFDITPFASLNPYWLFLVGFVLTAIIQSSSAAMVITLSALNAGLIALPAAAAMVIGSDLGTTITTIFGGITGTPAKKRVALSHFLFNLIVDLISLALLFPLLSLVVNFFPSGNPLMQLVAFHSVFNLLGIFIFLPFLKPFARFLEQKFSKNDQIISRNINNVPAKVSDAALTALNKEVQHLQQRIFHQHLQTFGIYKAAFYQSGLIQLPDTMDATAQYMEIKELEGELVDFYLRVQNEPLNRNESVQLKQLILAIRYAMTASKTIKDIEHNILEFKKTINDDLLQLFNDIKTRQGVFYLSLFQVFLHPDSMSVFENLVDLKKNSKENYNFFLEDAYQRIRANTFSDLEISTLFNVNREIHSANKAFIQSIKEVLIDQEAQNKNFDMVSN